ncbi:MAG: FHA domain-containing protein [Clostridiales bacterium]|nr:FHA domain-containing protein [Clostridiales bacterium]
MKLIQCSKGHYYDSDKYADCPYCGNAAGGKVQVTVPLNQAGNQGAEQNIQQREEAYGNWTEQAAPPVAQKASRTAEELPRAEEAEQRPEQWKAPVSRESGYQASAWSRGTDDNRTVSYYSRTMGTEPVVGWLVAVEGNYFGESFKLKSGRNFVGRSPEMDIQLSMDNSVSRRKHAVIIYEPRAKKFIAQPGDSRELFYLNDEVVLNNVVMNAYDILLIGETKLLFIPLCGEKFSWEDIKEKQS